MKKIFYLLVVSICFIALPGMAGTKNSGRISLLNANTQKYGNELQVEFAFDYGGLSIANNDQVLLQPVIIGATDTLRMPYLLFPGKTRSKANSRKIRLYGPDGTLFPDPYATLYPTGKPTDRFTYRQTVPFANWMYGARIELWQDIYGCADCHQVVAHIPLNHIANPPVVAFLTPLADTLREERLNLYVDFPWDQSVIHSEFRNNAVELEKINRSMQRIAQTPGGRVQRIALTGYASPEGKYNYNKRLAARRVGAVQNYLRSNYPVDHVVFVLDTIPEDWEGVKEWILQSGIPYSSEVADIIDRVADPDARDHYIRQLDNSTTYNRLLREAYPPLRRVEYRVHYHADPFSPEQSNQIYQNEPNRLSPYELYRLADTYTPGSAPFNDIILTTVRLYPKNPAALNNAACISLQKEDLTGAREYLLQCEDSPQKTNNQGVLYMLEGNFDNAYRCFREASKCGCQEALLNQHNLERTHLQQ